MEERQGSRRLLPLITATGSLTGCERVQDLQSALAPASEQAALLAWLGWVMFIGAAIILAIVVILLAIGLWRGRSGKRDQALSSRQRWWLVLAGGAALPVVTLFPLLVISANIGRTALTPPEDALQIEVVGWRWWWEVRYLDEQGRRTVTTANEIHVPVGRPVRFRLIGGDVIHSFWAPNLQGKTDLIPGHPNTAWFEAKEPGVFRGQCAEYCGTQHAHMAFLVVAQPPEEFAQWLKQQAQPATPPASAIAERGRLVFMQSGCAECHAIRGTPAEAVLGPDLTHVASRQTLAAVTIPNTKGHMAGWVAGPQAIKPGNLMPALALQPQDLQALLHYLGTLE